MTDEERTREQLLEEVRSLRDRNALLRAALDGIPDTVFVKDAQGRYLLMNAPGGQLIGRPPADAVGQDDEALVGPELAQLFRETDRRVLDSGEATTFEQAGRLGGQPLTHMTTKSPLRGPGGEVRGVVGISRDITVRKRAEEELRRQKEILQTIFDHLPVMIVFVDSAGRVLLANREWERVTGWAMEVVRGRDLLAELYPDPDERGAVAEHILRPPPGWADFKTRTRDGRTLDTSWATVILSDGTRIAIGQDVTERKRTEHALEQYAARLQALSRRLVEVQEEERRRLARELHDELGQVLTGLTFALDAAAAVCPSEAGERLAEAQGLIRHALARIRDLSFDLRPAALDHLGLLPALRGLIDRYTAATRVRVNLSHAGLERRFPPEVETAAYRVVQEALTNAARHARVGEVAARVWVADDTLEIQVEDQGVGFDREAVLAAGESSGLQGMHERVRLLGGKLEIESTPGGGTHVMAELPLRGAGGNNHR